VAKLDFEKQLGGSSVETLAKLQAALGTKSKQETLALIRKDPEARKIAEKIIGAGSPAGMKSILNPAAAGAATDKRTERKAKVEF